MAELLPLLLLANRSMAMLEDEPEPALPFTTGADDEDEGPGASAPAITTSGSRKVAMKDFTPAERAEIINEGRHVRAGNRDRMNVEGTHYEHQLDDDDDVSPFLG